MFKLQPACKSYLWGGTKLRTAFNKPFDGDVLAETWELSCHPDGHSKIEGSDLTLAQYLTEHPQSIGTAGARFAEFPILIKLIDAQKDLSVQVHPNNDYAQQHEGQFGKTEMWYIVDCEPGASLYYGFEKEISKQAFTQAIENGTLCELLHKAPVQKGDVFFIEAGTIHAIGAGIVIAEIQQNSNVTYRVYDYGRVGPDGKQRDLHIAKAADVTVLKPAHTAYDFHGHLAQCDYFTVDKLDVNGVLSRNADAVSFHSLLFLSGSAEVCCGAETIAAQKGDSIFIGADSGAFTLSGDACVLHTYLEQPGYRIGIDLGGTNIKAGIVDRQNRLLATHSCKTLVERPWQEIVADMAQTAKTAAQKAGVALADCVSVGVGSPGTVDARTGIVVYSNNFPGWENIPLGEALRHLLKIPVAVSNDANCAALGEFVAGAAKGAMSTVLLTLGTGVGGGVVFDGKIFEGGPGGAELGHTTMIADGAACTCGRKGCMEAYCSATALIREAKQAAQEHPDSLMNAMCAENAGQMNGRIPFDAMRAGDETAKAVVQQYITWLGEGIVNMVNIFRPEVVLLSGGLCNEGENLTNPLNEFVRRYAFGGTRVAVPEVKRATLGNDAGILGAANLKL